MGIVSDIEIDRCHKIGPHKTKIAKDWDQPCTTVCRLNQFKDKHHILNNAKKLKITSTFIYEDFSKDTMALRKSLWEHVFKYLKQNKFACLNYKSIIVRDHNGVRWTLTCIFIPATNLFTKNDVIYQNKRIINDEDWSFSS